MTGSRAVLNLSTLCLVAACVAPTGEPSATASLAAVEVEAYIGLTASSTQLRAPATYLVADVSSLAGPSGSVDATGDEQLDLARQLAAELIRPDTPQASLELVAFDRVAGRPPSQCESPRGSWAATAIEQLRVRLSASQAASASRVVLVADLASECEIDLCDAGGRLAQAGAWLDVVSLGAAERPACLQTLRPDATRPGPRVRALTDVSPPRFRVERVGVDGAGAAVVVGGVAGGAPVRVPAGMVRVIVETGAQEEVVGPFMVEAGEVARVRIQSFPLSAGSETSWSVETRPRR